MLDAIQTHISFPPLGLQVCVASEEGERAKRSKVTVSFESICDKNTADCLIWLTAAPAIAEGLVLWDFPAERSRMRMTGG